MEKQNNEMTVEEYKALQEALNGTLFIPRFDEFITHVNTSFRIYAGVKDYEYLEYTAQEIDREAHSEKMLLDLLFTMRDIMANHAGNITLPLIDDQKVGEIKKGGES